LTRFIDVFHVLKDVVGVGVDDTDTNVIVVGILDDVNIEGDLRLK
jgi:hypothetical protein